MKEAIATTIIITLSPTCLGNSGGGCVSLQWFDASWGLSNDSRELSMKGVDLGAMQLPHGPGFRAVQLRLCWASAFSEFRPQLVYVLLLSLQSLMDSGSSHRASWQEGNHPSRMGLFGPGGAMPDNSRVMCNFIPLRQSSDSLCALLIDLNERSA